MKTTDEIYQKLNDLWWSVLESNTIIERFKDEFYAAALDEGYELTDIEEYWRL